MIDSDRASAINKSWKKWLQIFWPVARMLACMHALPPPAAAAAGFEPARERRGLVRGLVRAPNTRALT